MILISILPISVTKWILNFKIYQTIYFGKVQKVFTLSVSPRYLTRDIEKYLSSQPKKSNNDILGIDVVLLNESDPYISESLARVINKSLESGVFEQDWKNARVSPIYKDDGNVNDENNYRPISVTGHIAKMVESLVSFGVT